MRTNQEVFDSVMNWLTREGATRSFDSSKTNCVYYRKSDGNRCAIGGDLPLDLAKRLGDVSRGIKTILLEEDEFDEDYVDVDDDSFLSEEDRIEVESYYEGINPELLDKLQRMHDTRSNWGAEGFIGWTSARKIAEDFKLQYNYA